MGYFFVVTMLPGYKCVLLENLIISLLNDATFLRNMHLQNENMWTHERFAKIYSVKQISEIFLFCC